MSPESCIERLFGEVAERSIAADCKSAAQVATEVRTLPSPPAFARYASFGSASQPKAERTLAVAGFTTLARAGLWRCRRAGLPRRSAKRVGGSNSVVESQPSKLLVAGSIPVSRSIRLRPRNGRRRATCRFASYGWQATSACPPKRVARRWIGKPAVWLTVDSAAADLSAVARKREGRCSSVGRARPW